jgi:transposase
VRRAVLDDVGSLVTPDTLRRWYRELIAAKYDGSAQRRPGRPRKPQEIRDLVVRLASENLGWGYTKIRDAMALLGHSIARTTVGRILQEQGMEPAPERRKHEPWARFLKTHWGAIAATDFFEVEVMTWHGLVRYAVLFVMDLKTRVVHIAGILPEPIAQSTSAFASSRIRTFTGSVRTRASPSARAWRGRGRARRPCRPRCS